LRILVLGGSGMLGHKLFRQLSLRFPETYATLRQSRNNYEAGELFKNSRVIDFVDVTDFSILTDIMKRVRPGFIFNCTGITKRRKEADESIQAILINSLFPHKLVEWAGCNSAKVVNFSTDCVFDGHAGNYDEKSPTNASDIYGKTKALGEVKGEHALTLRSSFIGTELGLGMELLEWFLSQRGTVYGFSNAIYTGLTTLELCRVIENILMNHAGANGLYNVSSEPISKYELLKLIKQKMNLDIEVVPNETVRCDRSLNSTKFRREFNYTPPSWEKMIEELSKDIKESATL
jgi:dTDP-4-dehydrorhamnose reductase